MSIEYDLKTSQATEFKMKIKAKVEHRFIINDFEEKEI